MLNLSIRRREQDGKRKEAEDYREITADFQNSRISSFRIPFIRGAGVFRKDTLPLGLKDLRELYQSDIDWLRKSTVL